MVEGVAGFEAVDATAIEEWLVCDNREPGYEVKDDKSILSDVNHSTDEDETVELDPPHSLTTHHAALEATETLLKYLEENNDSSVSDVMNVRYLQRKIKNNMIKYKKQSHITDYFKL
ncbi:hypothetical protein MML48_9g00011247 [Holotrichia oblita]|uniref:Uncharacterized protein n=1 Tax=Holotrichia oblita TaxID=644536 RepID=A0ACB9SIS4_HOLOL|nr:hypothetical protein MML48_9g00011247 [Holotrichia oblita]